MENYLNILLSNPNLSHNSKYVKWYIRIIASRNTREPERSETHHILPKSIYPEYKNDLSNLIKLTCKEHYIVHLLLWKMFKPGSPERSKMAFAVKRFRSGNFKVIITSRKYSLLRSDLKHTEETKEKIRLSNTGKKVSAETIEKLRESHLGNRHAEETKEKLRSMNLGKKLSESHKKKISEGNRGKIVSEESRIKMSNAKIGISGESHPCYGFTHSDETRKRMSDAHKDKPLSEDTKKSMRLAQKDRIWITNGIITTKVNKFTVLEFGWKYGMGKRR